MEDIFICLENCKAVQIQNKSSQNRRSSIYYIQTSTKFVHRCVRFKFSIFQSDQLDQKWSNDQNDQSDPIDHSV